jgi:hypothetical protein
MGCGLDDEVLQQQQQHFSRVLSFLKTDIIDPLTRTNL